MSDKYGKVIADQGGTFKMFKTVIKDSYKGESWGEESDSGESLWLMLGSMLFKRRVLIPLTVALLVAGIVAFVLFK